MDKDTSKEKWKEIYYGLAYKKLMDSWRDVEKRCKDPNKVEERAKNRTIYSYTMTVFLYIVSILSMLSINYPKFSLFRIIGNNNVIQFYILVCILFLVLGYLLEFILRKTMFKNFWGNVYKCRDFVEKPYASKYEIIAFILSMVPFILVGLLAFLLS